MDLINLPLPRPVTDIHQIEVTSRCNLRCKYCPSPNLQRPKVDMTWEHFEQAISLALYFKGKGTQGEINMAGIGESTLHPQFKEMLVYSRKMMNFGHRILFATNGILFDEELAKLCAQLNVDVYVSMHRPEKAGPAINIARRHGVLRGASGDPALQATDWAGQVKWEVTVPRGRPCDWIREGKVMVMADGRITACSFDASGIGVIGRLGQNEPLETKPYGLCAKCDQFIGVAGYEQFPNEK